MDVLGEVYALTPPGPSQHLSSDESMSGNLCYGRTRIIICRSCIDASGTGSIHVQILLTTYYDVIQAFFQQRSAFKYHTLEMLTKYIGRSFQGVMVAMSASISSSTTFIAPEFPAPMQPSTPVLHKTMSFMHSDTPQQESVEPSRPIHSTRAKRALSADLEIGHRRLQPFIEDYETFTGQPDGSYRQNTSLLSEQTDLVSYPQLLRRPPNDTLAVLNGVEEINYLLQDMSEYTDGGTQSGAAPVEPQLQTGMGDMSPSSCFEFQASVFANIFHIAPYMYGNSENDSFQLQIPVHDNSEPSDYCDCGSDCHRSRKRLRMASQH